MSPSISSTSVLEREQVVPLAGGEVVEDAHALPELQARPSVRSDEPGTTRDENDAAHEARTTLVKRMIEE